jgi:hypothetical protein
MSMNEASKIISKEYPEILYDVIEAVNAMQ